MSVGQKYYPPRVSVNVFNPDNFLSLGQTNATVTNQATVDKLKADTDAITTDANTQNARFKLITDIFFDSPPVYNETISFSGYINGTQTFQIPYVFGTGYYYTLAIIINYTQLGTVVPIPSIVVTDSWTGTSQFWTGPSNTNSANPTLQASFSAAGNNTNPVLTFTYPGTTSGNQFTATGKFSVIGLQRLVD